MNYSVFCSRHFKLEIKNIFFNLKCSFFSVFLKVDSWCLADHVGLLVPAQTQLTLCLIKLLNIFLVSLTTRSFMDLPELRNYDGIVLAKGSKRFWESCTVQLKDIWCVCLFIYLHVSIFC